MHTKKQHLPHCFSRSSLTWQASLLRLALLWRKMIPSEWNKWLTSLAFQSILVDPAFSVQTFREASAIRRLFPPHRFADAYQGFRIPIPPLFLAAVEPLLGFSEGASLITGIILIVVDYCIAWNLEQIGRALIQRASPREEYLEHRMPERIRPPLAHVFGIGRSSSEASKQVFLADSLPLTIANLYYLSPVSILSGSLLHCFQNIPVLCLVIAVRQATCRQSGTLVWSACWLALASYVSLHNILFAIPIALWFQRQSRSMMVFLVMFVSLSIFLQFLNILLVGQQDYWSVFLSTHGAIFKLSNLAPSLSTLWYLGMELFERFSRYLTFALAGLPYVVVAPTVIRLHGYAEALTAIFWLLGTLFRPPATLFSLNIGFCLLLLSPRTLARMRLTPSLVALCALPVPISLYLVDHWLWLETSTGEANFVFFQCLAYNVFVAIIFIQFCSSTLKRDKALRLIEKMTD